jgi:hypothetical protein
VGVQPNLARPSLAGGPGAGNAHALHDVSNRLGSAGAAFAAPPGAGLQIETRVDAVKIHGAQLANRIRLHLALGGGFDRAAAVKLAAGANPAVAAPWVR